MGTDIVTSIDELADLKRRVLETDLSLNNPRVILLIEDALVKWLGSYSRWAAFLSEGNKTEDVYGNITNIPIQIRINGNYLTPVQIVREVYERSQIGQSILERLIESRKKDIFWGQALKEGILSAIPEGVNPDSIFITCCCGQHNQTYRQALEAFIRIDLDSTFVNVGWPETIKSLYGSDAVYASIAKAGEGKREPAYRRLLRALKGH